MKRHHRRSHIASISPKENNAEQNFFGKVSPEPFFQPAILRKCENCKEEDKIVNRRAEKSEGVKIEKGENAKQDVVHQSVPNKINFAHCNGVTVSGNTVANYSSSFSTNGTPAPATACTGCSGPQCITISGNVISVFRANPVVTLPAVPAGLNACERAAVRSFINTTLRRHEQQHVAAFNSYVGRVTTPFSFTGCQPELNAYVRSIHDSIEVPRRDAANAQSDLLDASGANIFTITCDCPDPEPDAGKK